MKVLNEKGKLLKFVISQRETMLYLPKHPNAKSGNLCLSRLQAAKALGKPLPVKAVVHHYNGHLIICQNQKYHLLLHTRQQAFEATGDSNKRKCIYCKLFDHISNMIEKSKTNGALEYVHRACLKLYNQEYRIRNKEEINKKARENYELIKQIRLGV
jgi:hypothetical protein